MPPEASPHRGVPLLFSLFVFFALLLLIGMTIIPFGIPGLLFHLSLFMLSCFLLWRLFQKE
jgi:hypothetical protein